jgi:hypothetical protein
MASIYEKQMPTIQKYMKHFRVIDGQVGAVYMINGKIAGMDAFGKYDTFRKVFKKLLGSYALDTIDWYDPEREHKALNVKYQDIDNPSLRVKNVRTSITQSYDLPLKGQLILKLFNQFIAEINLKRI